MSDVFVLQYDDSDYYCEGDHVLGVFTTRELAEAAIIEHTTRFNTKPWGWTYTIAQWSLDELTDKEKPVTWDTVKAVALGAGVSIGYSLWVQQKYGAKNG